MKISDRIALTARMAFAAGILGLAITCLLAGTFAMQWQPIAPWIPRELSYVSNAVLLLAGLVLLSGRWETRAAGLVVVIFGFWLVAFKVPETVGLIGQVTKLRSWIGTLTAFFEEVAIVGGGLALHIVLRARAGLAVAPIASSVARFLFGVACLEFGLSHFAFAEATAGMIPSWIPARVPLAYLTGAAHLCAGLAILAGPLLPKLWHLAAALETAMMSSFVVLVHIPMVLAPKPGTTQSVDLR